MLVSVMPVKQRIVNDFTYWCDIRCFLIDIDTNRNGTQFDYH